MTHKSDCYVYVHARELVGKDRTGLCTCGLFTAPDDKPVLDLGPGNSALENALIALRNAHDGHGLRIRIDGGFTAASLTEALINFVDPLTPGTVFMGSNFRPSARSRATYFRNLALIATAAAAAVEYEAESAGDKS